MIKLKEELKNINNNKLSRIKVIAKQVRTSIEKDLDWEDNKICFKETCSWVSEDLVKELKKNNIRAYVVHGFYYGAPADFEPDMTDWDGDEVNDYLDGRSPGEPFGFNHWWVVAENKWIIDITSDQFFPNEENEHRVVITTIDDSDYNS